MNLRGVKIAGILILALLVTVAMVGVSFAANEVPAPSASASQAVKGEVLMTTDEFLVVKEPIGKGLQLFFDKGTKRDTTIKAGDKIEAQVSPDGHAKSITIVNSATSAR